ncbi:vanadium-dependent haloperoxidase [Sorangium sp. So ce429]
MNESAAAAGEIGPIGASARRDLAYSLRVQAAQRQRLRPLPVHVTNGDEALPNLIAAYSKGLPHNELGEVNADAYGALIQALTSGNPQEFEALAMGGVVKQISPQAAYAFSLEGADSHALTIPAPPAFSSAQMASELAELYWQALTRDVNFADYAADPMIDQAVADMNAFSDFRGPKSGGLVTPGTLFRGLTPGDQAGPYISQFLYKDIPFGATSVPQKYIVGVADLDFVVTAEEWLGCQRGTPPTGVFRADPAAQYIRNNRGLCEYVHRDFGYQPYLAAALILFTLGPGALDPANPYVRSATQAGGVTYGGAQVLEILAHVMPAALYAAFHQKWLVHRRLRPETYAGRLHHHMMDAATYPFHDELLDSDAINAVAEKHGTYLLPQAYVEACPTHPSYPAAHAVIAGACVTVLKALFNESFVIPNPVVPSADGLSLVPYAGGDALTIGGELDKLASNISIGRNAAGVHYRSDGDMGLLLGEKVALTILADRKGLCNEGFSGYSLTKFNGTTVTVG